MFSVPGQNRGHQRAPIYTLAMYILTQKQVFLSIKHSLITFPHLSDVSIKHALIIWPGLFMRWKLQLVLLWLPSAVLKTTAASS